MYVKQYRGLDTPYSSTTLCEMTLTQYRRALTENNKVTIKVSAAEARQWVRNGGHHSTYLWIDDTGRIRRANPSH